ncbi:MAG: YncE family protein, partial [Rhodanobacteraceae bacterium]
METSVIDLKDDADNVRYDAESERVFVGYGGGALAMLDPGRAQLVSSVGLSAHPESFQLEQNGSRIFVNVPEAHEVAVLDRRKGETIAKWSTGTARANFPMALDEKNARLFIGCRRPAKLLVLDTASGKVVN